MTTDRINAAMAELEGLRVVTHDGVLCSAQPWPEIARPLDDYTADLNATQRVFRTLDNSSRISAINIVIALCGTLPYSALALATPLQWCEAILRATGKWEDGE